MRFAAAVGIALATAFSTHAQDAPTGADPCELWVVNGYRAGMAQEAALSVRPAKAKKDGLYAVKEPGRLDGRLTFSEGKLLQYVALIEGASTSEVVGALREKLGDPAVEHHVKRAGNSIRTMTIWTSASCDAAVYVIELKTFSTYGESTSTNVVLTTASNAERTLEKSKARGESAIK